MSLASNQARSQQTHGAGATGATGAQDERVYVPATDLAGERKPPFYLVQEGRSFGTLNGTVRAGAKICAGDFPTDGDAIKRLLTIKAIAPV